MVPRTRGAGAYFLLYILTGCHIVIGLVCVIVGIVAGELSKERTAPTIAPIWGGTLVSNGCRITTRNDTS